MANNPIPTLSYLGRINADGSLDNLFKPGLNSYVFPLAAQPDGKVVVGGFFSKLGWAARSRIRRLNEGIRPAQPTRRGARRLAVWGQ